MTERIYTLKKKLPLMNIIHMFLDVRVTVCICSRPVFSDYASGAMPDGRAVVDQLRRHQREGDTV